MAMDVYVGPLSRYHSGDWKTLGQMAAEQMGIEYVRMAPEGNAPSPAEVLDAVLAWRDQIQAMFAQTDFEAPRWNESPEQDYYTDRPGWEGLAGVVFKFAYLLNPNLKEPAVVPLLEKMDEDPAARAVMAEPGLFQVLGMCELWLPGDFEFAFQAVLVTGKTVVVSSTALLNSALDQVCSLWQKDRAEVTQGGLAQPGPDAPLDEAALYGLGVFCRAADYATEHKLPMVLDY